LYLKSLTLRGFKSFASTTTLRFEPGVTAVVGPNGSGKSNVVDALSWVMGEQGPKTLRGGKMEDVIFAGTSARAPLGRAEVVLTIDNSDGARPIEYNEVTISRTMFRSGGSDYAINGSPARLLDVQELLSDSGIGREMHVIVGQGQLDTILNATPETRRGLIEEAAGVLKHRKRKERAERKLDATALNLNRLNDLLGEIRRQLKPLGKQAEVARRASGVQAELRDAQARLLADDYTQARSQLLSDEESERLLNERRAAVEAELAAARDAEAQAEQAVAATVPQLTKSQETWFALAALRERAASTGSIAAERIRHLEETLSGAVAGRDPAAIQREAEAVRAAEAKLRAEAEAKAAEFSQAAERRQQAEAEAKAAEDEYAAAQRAVADRREGLARLAGEVNAMRGRVEAATAEIERITAAKAEAEARQAEAKRSFAVLETNLASWSAEESGLDSAYEQAEAARAELESNLAELTEELNTATARRAALAARAEALELGLERGGAESALLATSGKLDGLLGAVSALVTVPKGYEAAISAALGAAADAVAVLGLDNAVASFELLKREDLGRAGILLAGAALPSGRKDWPPLKNGEYAIDIVEVEKPLRPALERLLYKVAVVDGMDAAVALVKKNPELTAVTTAGDLLSSWFAAGGSASQPTLIEVQSALAEAQEQLSKAQNEVERLRFAISETEGKLAAATQAADAALERLNESDAAHAALAEQASHLNQTVQSAQEAIARYGEAAAAAAAGQERAVQGLAALEDRLRRATAEPDQVETDPVEKERLADVAALARAAEMEAQLALNTVEERARSLADRAESLERSAAAEKDRLEQAAVRRAAAQQELATAQAVRQAVAWLAGRIATALADAESVKDGVAQRRAQAEQGLAASRQRGRELAKDFEELVSSAHKDQLAKAEARMKLEAIAEKAMDELGLDAEALQGEYGPDKLIPVPGEDGEEHHVPYARAEQERRLRNAKRDLAVLGKVNPLALEEFEAMQERHAYLSEQLEDLRKTRADLLGIIEDVDERMKAVFEAAYADVAREFAAAFARLFPGGDGKLFLTEPDAWLTTGVDVEARPAGKKVKRLSLLSGGERALTAIAFLVALFKARPSPFYILDEVEAALDDVNLSRLLGIYEELREDSQLLIITHQKRTMEIADALFGVTMGSDGVSTVISQRLRDS
jgi:chromosome segregation protein